ncbi:MAG: hypothetical protein E3J35_08435 [Methanomassiliicoccales archaeon]|nr:MAG: hypothetical protein E3J35_08435 [Methanomassiliicoccales archaeon]
MKKEERKKMKHEIGRIPLAALVLATLCISVLPSVEATDYTERGYEATTVNMDTVTADATGPQNHNLDVEDDDNVIVNVTCNYNDTRIYGALDNRGIHYYNVSVTYQSNTEYDDETVITHDVGDSGTTYLEVSFQVDQSTTMYIYEYVSVTLVGEHQAFDQAWYNWTVTLI